MPAQIVKPIIDFFTKYHQSFIYLSEWSIFDAFVFCILNHEKQKRKTMYSLHYLKDVRCF